MDVRLYALAKVYKDNRIDGGVITPCDANSTCYTNYRNGTPISYKISPYTNMRIVSAYVPSKLLNSDQIDIILHYLAGIRLAYPPGFMPVTDLLLRTTLRHSENAELGHHYWIDQRHNPLVLETANLSSYNLLPFINAKTLVMKNFEMFEKVDHRYTTVLSYHHKIFYSPEPLACSHLIHQMEKDQRVDSYQINKHITLKYSRDNNIMYLKERRNKYKAPDNILESIYQAILKYIESVEQFFTRMGKLIDKIKLYYGYAVVVIKAVVESLWKRWPLMVIMVVLFISQFGLNEATVAIPVGGVLIYYVFDAIYLITDFDF